MLERENAKVAEALQQAQANLFGQGQEELRQAQLHAEAETARRNKAITDEADRVIEQQRQQRVQSEQDRGRAEE